MSGLDTSSSIAGTVSLLGAEEAAAILRRAGWSVRKAGFHEFEIRGEDFELYIESASPVLIHGPSVDPESIAIKLAAAFRDAGARFSFELYDPKQNLISVVADEEKA